MPCQAFTHLAIKLRAYKAVYQFAARPFGNKIGWKKRFQTLDREVRLTWQKFTPASTLAPPKADERADNTRQGRWLNAAPNIIELAVLESHTPSCFIDRRALHRLLLRQATAITQSLSA